MSHYEKLAIASIPAIGRCISVYALIGMVYNAVKFLFFHEEAGGRGHLRQLHLRDCGLGHFCSQ